MKTKIMLFCCMAATLLLACSNDKSEGHDDSGFETEVNGTQLVEGTTLYGLITDTAGNPVQGVVVSDGYKCVTTDANGVYQMERYKKARFVYYSTPAAYAINTAADNFPLFYAEIVHKNIADRHDFTLTPLAKAETDFTLLCIADPQCASTSDISRYVNETIPDIEATVDAYKAKGKSVYGITLGDIVFDTPDLWSNMKESMSGRNLPIFQTIGNHDHLASESSDDNAARNFESQFGPRNYSFDRGNAHIVSIDNVIYLGNKKYNGGIEDKHLEWLRQDLSHVSKDKLVILCAHIPFRAGTSVTDESHKNHGAVMDLLAEFAEAHIMIGHTHYHQKYNHSRGGKTICEHVHGAACGGWWTSNLCADGTPNGYGVYEISGNGIASQYYKSTNKPADYQLRAYAGKQVFGKSGSTTFGFGANKSQMNDEKCIVANVWNAAKDNSWKITLWQDGSQVGTMTRITTMDYWAYAYHVLFYSKSVGTTWGKSLDHYYYGKLRSGTPETVDFEIVVEDGQGNTYRTSKLQTDFVGF
ncbi:calcineurin-like phosphoesterase family protein [uncultured Alistipes sp.]|uniref:calcineurin-like phosphoesterase family protein n=1 Tax=uncultured Alistipes sp. TaxID=538949 RepID=UPI0025F6395F|nr:calcineurin-like phosphoesterase family protein [uncultured Alistipes sp.]